MQKKLTILWAFAFYVLVVGWAITPAQADKPNGGKHNHGGDDDPPTATVNADLGMDITNLPVTVSQDASKRIRFVNSDFGPLNPKIEMQFLPNIANCSEAHGTTVSKDDKDKLVAVLQGAEIERGFFIAKRNREQNTGQLLIEYTDTVLGVIQISFGGFGTTATVTEDEPSDDGSIKFHITGTIFVAAFGESGRRDDQIVACTTDQSGGTLHADVILHK